MLDRQGRLEYDARKKQEKREYINEIIKKNKTQESYLTEQIPIQELKILKQMGIQAKGKCPPYGLFLAFL